MPTLGRYTEDELELDLDGAVCDWCHRRVDEAPRIMSTSLGIKPAGDDREVFAIICSRCVGKMAQAFVAQGALQLDDLAPDERGGLLDFRNLAKETDPES